MRTALLLVGLVLVAPSLAAQDTKRPDGWKVRFDRANADAASHKFWEMSPGWHITTGPAGIMYNPSHAAKGKFRVESAISLFPTNGRDREAFGILFGGQDLDGDGQSYTYFLIRNDGSYLVKQRKGRATTTVIDWTSHAAIVKNASDDETAKNVLAVEAGAEQVDFYINGTKVTSVPRVGVQCDGIVGIRVNHGLNLHVTSLDVKS
jgi:hypothetical protein